MKVFYFGCWDEKGHFLWIYEQEYVRVSNTKVATPFGYGIDGFLQKGSSVCLGNGVPDDAQLHHKDGWTALAFWDQTVDTRPGSCSVFLAEGTHEIGRLRQLAREHFPDVWDRLHGRKIDE